MAPSSAKAKVVNNWSFIVLVDDLILIVQVILIYEVNSHTSEEAEWTRVAVKKGHASHSKRSSALVALHLPSYPLLSTRVELDLSLQSKVRSRVRTSRREMAGRSVEERRTERQRIKVMAAGRR